MTATPTAKAADANSVECGGLTLDWATLVDNFQHGSKKARRSRRPTSDRLDMPFQIRSTANVVRL